MKKTKKLIAICMLIAVMLQCFCITSFAVEQNTEDKATPSGLLYSDIQSTIENYVSENLETTAGMSVAVYDENGTIYEDDFGYTDKENSKLVDKNTVYDWGSVSKLLIWISSMQLAEQGALDLNEDIQTYLPEGFLKNLTYDKKITMIDLMNHQAGFQEMYFTQTVNENKILSLEQALSKNQPKQVYEPRTVTAYSNWGASLAAYIVQNISGMDYAEYVRKNIFEPLDMKHTSINANLSDNMWVKEQREKLICYDINGDKIPNNGDSYCILYPAGSATGTIDDFLVFAKAITPNSNKECPLFKNQETIKEMYTATSYYGDSGVPNNYHGFFANQLGVEILGHGGNTFACSSMLQFDPDTGIGMVVMTNQAHEQVYNYDMYELVFGKFTDSELANIEREVPQGMISAARSVKEGPLSIVGGISVLNYSEEDLNSWWYQDGNRIYGGYSDYFIDTETAIFSTIFALLFMLSGVYGIITLVGGGLICSPIQKRIRRKKGIEKTHSFRKWNYAMSAMMAVIFIDFISMFIRMNMGTTSGNIGSITSYMVQSGIIAFMTLALIVCLISGLIYWFRKGIIDTKLEKTKYCVTILMSLCMLAVILLFDMYQFWAL